MKYGISLKINVSQIEKARLFKGQKGQYLDATVFVDTDNPDQYQNHGMITQDVSKEERTGGVKGPILGNCKIFYTAESGQQQGWNQQGYQPQNQQLNQRPSQGGGYQGGYVPPQQNTNPAPPGPVDDGDIPF